MKSNNTGFTLIEVMVAVGLLSMVTMGLMFTSKMMLDIKKNNDQNFQVDSTISEISIALNKEPICTSFNLDQVTFDPTNKLNLNDLKVSANDQLLVVNQKISNNLTVSKIFVDNFQVAQTSATHTDYIADLNIEILRDSGIGSNQIIKTIPVNIIAENISSTQGKAIKCRANDSIVGSDIILAGGTPSDGNIQNFETQTCALFGGSYNANTGLCENAQMNSAQVPSNQLRCGHCLQGGGSTIDNPCMGQSLCGPSGSCPSNFNLIHLQGSSTSIGVGSEKYCQPM
ncbi:MAG: prepilin-type N-terminal cleavage/methylation domain-containing protein [Bdellovibrionales bacterium]|nr:prepilin-type N-terminal cleavage/methylation domain-containing protein [Bdellovibrionales bacterium]